MCAENSKNKEFSNAVDYIKNSSIFSNQKYLWVAPLLSKTLDDSLMKEDIGDVINKLLSKEISENEDGKNKKDNKNVVANIVDNNNEQIVKIKSIDIISNIGLLEIDQEKKISLNGDLKIFYGKNGAGKSSFYLGLCKVFGKNKLVFSNINNECNDSCCQITCINKKGEEVKLKWESKNEDLPELNIMIFDGLISNFIIKEDQVNSFKMAHLKIEYFDLLYDLYDEVENCINLEKNDLDQEIQSLHKSLKEKVPFIFEDKYTLDYKKLLELNFTDKEEKELEGLEAEIKKITHADLKSVIKNLENVYDEIVNILRMFGERVIDKQEDGEDIEKWDLTYTKSYFEKINKQISEYLDNKKAFEGGSKIKISSLIPKDWITNTKWEKFIGNSIEFLNSLEVKSKKKYSDEKCVYCHQSLQTEEAKALIKAYQEIHKEYKDKLNSSLKKIDVYSEELNKCIILLNKLPESNKKIEAELEHFEKKGSSIQIENEKLTALFQSFKDSIDNKKKIKEIDVGLVSDLWTIYTDLAVKFQSQINKLNEAIKDKETKTQQLNQKAGSLRVKKALVVNRDDIVQYIKSKKVSEDLDVKIGDISSVRQNTSTLKTSFSQQAVLGEFQNNLKNEYNALGFNPPSSWKIKPATRGGVNRRVYNIGDRKLSEIFSEGEQKLHALSDFLAQCESNKYKGVYIFDDPVNSLDEDNIEAVAERILELVKEGNQVIIFTHNLVFLNSIIDTQNEKITRFDRLSDRIIIEPDINIGNNQKLKERLGEINSSMLELSKITEQVIPEHKLRNVYDLMSGYLEDYVEIVYFKNIINRYRPNIRMHSLDNLKGIETDFIDEILSLYKKTSRRGARHSQPLGAQKPQYSELKGDVEVLKKYFKY